MSTTDLGTFKAQAPARAAAQRQVTALGALRAALAPLASLRLTVVLLFLSIVLVLAGTLAQVDYEIWYVVNSYFRTWWAWFELRIFFPRTWGISPEVGFPFLGGKAIGLALAVNLIAAHSLRFKMAARGGRLWLGWATIAIGAAITYAVVVSGANTAVESELSAGFTRGLWHALRASVGAIALTLAYVLALTRVTASKSAARWLWWIGAVTAALLAGLAVYLFMNPAAQLNASGLRILWQLAKATVASVVLGAGCWAVFGKRAGIVLLHGGIGLLMFTELYTAQNVVEARMTIPEGGTAYFADDIRSVELAFTDVADKDTDRSSVIPGSMLQAALESKQQIAHDDLPYDVQVVRWLPNARPRLLQPGEKGAATAGLGELYTADEVRVATGVNSEQGVDLPAAYVELFDKDDGKSRGVFLVSPIVKNEPLSVGGKNYELALRFKRIPKPYQVTLNKFKFDRYLGTNTAKNYESLVHFEAPEQNISRDVSISMNNPLRYGGDTLYQSSFDEKTEKSTVLQVVTNSGWMVPYVACMIVAAGMLVHFTQAIVRFIFRREDEARRVALAAAAGGGPIEVIPWSARWRRKEYFVPALIVLLAAGYSARKAAPVRETPLEMHLYEFGELPIAYGGRTQPIDALARNTLRLISGRATYEDARFVDDRQPAIRWFLDVVSRSPEFREHRVFRVEDLDVLQTLGLPQRPGEWRYSVEEIYKKPDELDRQVALLADMPEEQLNLMQQNFRKLFGALSRVRMLIAVFSQADVQGETREQVLASLQDVMAEIQRLRQGAPRAVPPATPEEPWRTLLDADLQNLVAGMGQKEGVSESPAAKDLLKILAAYAKGDAAGFNAALVDYQTQVDAAAAAERKYVDSHHASDLKLAERLDLDRINFEAYFNHFDPFMICFAFYIAAFVLAALAWFGWAPMLNRSANWLLWFTLAIHTFGLIGRIYISGRPPVTNLYSSAVFISWAGVLIALIYEAIYKLGIGNLLAAIIGFPTMVIAYQLTFDAGIEGDTFGVMQAVLDTNFWLATHVVCISLGYATTLLAGGLGLLQLAMGYIGGALAPDQRRQLSRMTYGTLCFAIFFSFIGTVLGGLWADDSWGRFWGWDPKENGALMIVLWNAIVLHARWGKMIGDRGLASLAVFGNIVVAWSWWGVNQLGVGLHSYGKTSGVTLALAIFDAAMIAVIIAAYAAPLLQRRAPSAATLPTDQ